MAEVIKQTMYDKTPRMAPNTFSCQITEKLDGSNLAFFVLEEEGERTLYIAQRKTIFDLETALSGEVPLYRRLKEYLEENGAVLRDAIYPGSVVIGEWIGMGALNYTGTDIDQPFYMFAKARLTDDWKIEKIVYDLELLPYAFNNRQIPECVAFVPLVTVTNTPPTLTFLDEMYANYGAEKNRAIEGFVITTRSDMPMRCKYVRLKNKKLTPHWWNEAADGKEHPVPMTVNGPLQ